MEKGYDAKNIFVKKRSYLANIYLFFSRKPDFIGVERGGGFIRMEICLSNI